jgi:ribosomal protein L31E
LVILNTRNFLKKFAQKHFRTQSELGVKINLDQMVNEEDWIKSMYIKYITILSKCKVADKATASR